MRCRNCNAELPEDAEWCNQCLTPVTVEGQHEPVDRPEPEPLVMKPPEYSALRQGPYSFGIVGKLIITAIVVGLGLILIFAGQWFANYLEMPGVALVLVIMVPYTVIGLIVLWGTWRPTRVK